MRFKIEEKFKKKEQKKYKKQIATEIVSAEEYHQRYLEKNPSHVCSIKVEEFLEKQNK